MASRSSSLIIVLVAVLLAVVAGSGVVVWFFTSNQSGQVPSPLAEFVETAPTADSLAERTPPPGDATFNTAILRSSRYSTLDVGLVTSGALPVQPPSSVGKANPFL